MCNNFNLYAVQKAYDLYSAFVIMRIENLFFYFLS